MLYDERDRVQVRNAALALTTLAWILALWNREVPAHHHGVAQPLSAGAAVNWLLMLAAMMVPALIQPLQFVRSSGLARRRMRATLLFAAGYLLVWMPAGTLLTWLAVLHQSSGLSPSAGTAAAFLVALAWQCSPAKQVCLNRCHAFRPLVAFGHRADLDSLVFGVRNGAWCVGSCWALMLLPLLLPNGHVAAMAAISVLVFCERLEGPAPSAWRWRGFSRVRKVAVGRINLVLNSRPPERRAANSAG